MRLTKEFEIAKQVLDNSQVIAFPTETVMGLGVYFNDKVAYELLNKIKNRPEDKPYTLMLGDKNDIEKYAFVSERDKTIINAFVPGPVTLLLKSKDIVPGYVTHNTGVIGVRVPDMELVQELIKYCGTPLLVPSANKSGEKPAMNSDEVKCIFKEEVAFIFEGSAKGGVPSTLVDLTGKDIKIYREGNIKLQDIEKAIEEE